MKINKFLLGAFALSVGFASCSNEEPIKGNDVAQVNETRFMSVQISAPAQTSRADFEDGATAESSIDHLDFLFFDKNGNATGTSAQVSGSSLTYMPGGSFENGNVTKIGTSVVGVELNQGDNLPAQVICVVNGSSTLLDQMKGKSITDLRNVVNAAGSFSDNNGNMIMANSMFFGQDPITGQADQRVVASPVRSSQLYSSANEAAEAMKDAIKEGATAADQSVLVNVYVERVAAKVGLNLPSTNVEGNPTIETLTLAKSDGSGNVTVKFVPEYWFMNATSKENFPIKRYGLSLGEDGIMDTPTYALINAKFDGTQMANNWNDPDNHRSYWGCSPSYHAKNYPLVSDQVNDLEGNTTNYTSKYYSYNEVAAAAEGTYPARQAIPAAETGTFAAVGGQTTGYIYTNETTAALSVINNATDEANPAAAVASAVIVGHYVVTDGEGDATQKTFYVDRNDGDKYYADAATARAALAKRQTLLRANADGTGTLPAEAFVLEHPKKAVRDLLKNPYIAGRLVTIQLDKDALPVGGAYIWNGSSYVSIADLDINEVNAQLVSTGYMDMFANGLAFYSIPVRHLGFREASYKDGKYLWSEMQLGELGLVRNHVYTINVTKIGGLGTGLRSPEQPILPARELYNQYVAVRLNVLAWNVVPSWKVEL